jgi:hypothetical protein
MSPPIQEGFLVLPVKFDIFIFIFITVEVFLQLLLKPFLLLFQIFLIITNICLSLGIPKKEGRFSLLFNSAN